MNTRVYALTVVLLGSGCGLGVAQVETIATRPIAVENAGPRNDAFKEAERKYGVPREFLMALAYQQGRFESASPEQTHATVISDDPELSGDEHDGIHHFGPMFLSLEQVAAGAQLTGLAEQSIRADPGANIVAGGALLAPEVKPLESDADWDSMTPFREAIARYLVLTDSPAAASLAVAEVHDLLRKGFSIELSDGEKLEVRGFGPELTTTARALSVGEYPAVEFIRSPNYSGRDCAVSR